MDFVVSVLYSSGYETDIILERKKKGLETVRYACFECFKIVI